MRKAFALSVALHAMLIAASAHAAEKTGPRCISLEKAQKAVGKGTTVTPLSPAQRHFLQGIYVVNPNTPDGLPPGEGALLLTQDGSDNGLILWTLGKLVCEPMPAPKKLIEYLAQIKKGSAGEGSDL